MDEFDNLYNLILTEAEEIPFPGDYKGPKKSKFPLDQKEEDWNHNIKLLMRDRSFDFYTGDTNVPQQDFITTLYNLLIVKEGFNGNVLASSIKEFIEDGVKNMNSIEEYKELKKAINAIFLSRNPPLEYTKQLQPIGKMLLNFLNEETPKKFIPKNIISFKDYL